MNEEEISMEIEKYEAHQSDIDRERASGIPCYPIIRYAEKCMARIEERFQRAGLDINSHL